MGDRVMGWSGEGADARDPPISTSVRTRVASNHPSPSFTPASRLLGQSQSAQQGLAWLDLVVIVRRRDVLDDS